MGSDERVHLTPFLCPDPGCEGGGQKKAFF